MDWVEQQINNEDLFPVTVGQCCKILYSLHEVLENEFGPGKSWNFICGSN